MPLLSYDDVSGTLCKVQSTLVMSQRQLGELLGCSRRTIIRYVQHGARLTADQWIAMARACHPRDPALAAVLAEQAGQTLVSLGLERPPPPPPPPPAPVRPAPSSKHLVDSIVCAAAEAMQTTPQAMRPALVAAFERALAVGMSADEVLAAMTAGAQVTKGSKGKTPSVHP